MVFTTLFLHFLQMMSNFAFIALSDLGLSLLVGQIRASSYAAMISSLGPPILHCQHVYKEYKHSFLVRGKDGIMASTFPMTSTSLRRRTMFRIIKTHFMLRNSFLWASLVFANQHLTWLEAKEGKAGYFILGGRIKFYLGPTGAPIDLIEILSLDLWTCDNNYKIKYQYF